MVSLSVRRSRNSKRPRDFAHTSHQAPARVRSLSQAYHHQVMPKSWWQQWRLHLAGLVVLGVTGAVIYTPLFTIRNVIVNHTPSVQAMARVEELVRGVMQTRRWGILPQTNLLLFSGSAAEAALAQEFYTAGLTFERHYPNVLRVNLSPDATVATWALGNKNYFLDRRGVLVQELLPGTKLIDKNLLSVHEVTAGAAGATVVDRHLGSQVAQVEVIDFLVNLQADWQREAADIPFQYVQFDEKALPTVQVMTASGWYVLVTASEPVETQLAALQRLLKEKIGTDITRLEYMDVRFGSRLYYKLR